MNQPPPSSTSAESRPQWLRPAGVAEGTWTYTQQRSIADHYGDFVASTPLCELDRRFLQQHFPALASSESSTDLLIASNSLPPNIVDFGCGNGRTAIPLANAGYRVTGIDLSQPMLDQARAAAIRSEQASRCSWVRANLVQLDCIASGSADHAVCLFSTLGMIQGREHRHAFLRHARRIVRPGGSFVLHVHNLWSTLSEPGGVIRLLKSKWRSRTSTGHEFGDHVYAYRGLSNMFLHRFSWRELRDDLIVSGWTIQQKRCISLDGITFVTERRWRPDRVGGFLVSAE